MDDDFLPESITAKKLNDVNYLAWAHAVRIYLCGKKKLNYLTNNPPASIDTNAGHGGFHGGRGGLSTHGVRGGHTGGQGDRKCDHCGATNHIEPYCWIKWGKPKYVHQVSDVQQPIQPPISSRHVPSNLILVMHLPIN
ncbi:hypothetical protein IFM89_007376 [Coptis chinensis]|uniref:Retrotransposon Copia-like N-terminal domain-containing protein n=1 Tax=Coptis chinensis TaxID=261450 RepID=A0A835ILS3_9MAGN|nr:hypothetical protein IFM89_007376 [Coptis chinensis]